MTMIGSVLGPLARGAFWVFLDLLLEPLLWMAEQFDAFLAVTLVAGMLGRRQR